MRHHQVGGKHRRDALHLVAVALRPQRADRPVDHPGGQDRALGRPAFSLEETAGDFPGGVHPLLDVNREREEIGTLARIRPPLGGREDHRVAGADDDCAVGLLGELARLEGDVLPTYGQGHGNRRRLLLGFDNAHLSCSSTVLVEGGGLSQSRVRLTARDSLKLHPPGFGS